MTLAELAEASKKAGEALREYKARWQTWRDQARSQITGHRKMLGKEVRRLEAFRETLLGLDNQIRDIDWLVESMTAPPDLAPDSIVRVSGGVTGEVIGLPPELRPIIGALAMFVQPPRMSGVYFLVRGASVVYVGKSVHLAGRIAEHANFQGEHRKFDRALFLDVPADKLNEVEAAFIRLLQPPYNSAGKTDPTDADQVVLEAIVAKCGMPTA